MGLQAVLASPAPLKQSTLSDLGRHGLRSYLLGNEHVPQLDDVKVLWDRLVETALAQNVKDKHLTAACNCVSVFLLSTVSSGSSEIRHFGYSSVIWFQGFDCVQKALNDGKTKPALQVLETLAFMLNEHSDKGTAETILRQSALRAVENIITENPRGSIKSSCIIISCFLRRTSISQHLDSLLTQLLKKVSNGWEQRQLQNNVQLDMTTLEAVPGLSAFFLALLFAINNLETRSAALKVFVQLCQADETTNDGPRRVQSAADMIRLFLDHNDSALNDFSDNVLPVIIDNLAHLATFLELYRPRLRSKEQQIVLFLSVLKVGRTKKLILEHGTSSCPQSRLHH